jgi:uncharacterized protein
MKTPLPVLGGSDWYADGLNFTCTQCGNCCSGPPGFVWITPDEIARLAGFLHLSLDQTIHRYCRQVGQQFALREHRNGRGQHDCVFLRDEPAESNGGQAVVHARRLCSIYPVRPLQCRTWPFWPGNLKSRRAWSAAAVRCHGMNRGRHFSQEQINRLQAAEVWPDQPPTSKESEIAQDTDRTSPSSAVKSSDSA